MLPISLVLMSPLGHLAKFSPSNDVTRIALLILPYCPACATIGPDSTAIGDCTCGGSAGGWNAFPVAAGLVNSNTKPTIASIATIPKSKMLISFLSVIFFSSFF